MSKSTHEYAFDAKMFAVIRVNAESKSKAEATAQNVLDTITLNYSHNDVTIAEVTLSQDDGSLYLLEIDGETPE